jgi:N-acetylneuraminic acid mutarotase
METKKGFSMRSHLVFSGIAALLITARTAYAQPTWSTLDHAPVARFCPAVTTGPDGRIYVFGGDYSSISSPYIPVAHAEVFDPSINPATGPAWTAIAPMPTARAGASAVVATAGDGNPRIFVIGGMNMAGALHTVEAYDPRSGAWSTLAAMPTARAYLSVTTGRDGLIYAIGGYDGGGAGLSTVEVYDPRQNAWLPSNQLAAMPTSRFSVASAVASDGRIYVIGGGRYSSYLRDVEAYDPATNTWERLPMIGRPRYAAAAVVASDGRINVIGGFEPSPGDGELRDVEVFDGTGWTTSPTMLTTARHGLGAAVDLQGRIYAIAGYHGGELNVVERWTP